MKPLFVHDCERCKFLGSMTIPLMDQVADVYMSCGKDLPSVIFRYSDEGPDYACVSTDMMHRYFDPKYFPK